MMPTIRPIIERAEVLLFFFLLLFFSFFFLFSFFLGVWGLGQKKVRLPGPGRKDGSLKSRQKTP